MFLWKGNNSMKKKVLFLVTMIAAAIFLVSCSANQQASLDGEYYTTSKFSEDGLSESPWIVIKDKTLTYYFGGKDDPSGTLRYSVDTEKKTLTGEGKTLAYSYDKESGVLSAGIMSGDEQFVKKDSKKYKELKKMEKD
ncbi:hypothetical protein VYH75_06035 [Streptococcus anginosus]|uniref:Lipoprotein n=2 Tax=Streptococcus anginosus TaxID=1328 RepID=A0A412PKY1_STRAP|nr:hypothetical protein [Streptococcus anginosus]KAA9228295.1 hypothetical protein F6I38_08295 [Streptococcus anginosus]KAA9305224.1 hypothetical protein F6I00_07150 [Streptococcus anginosus]MCW1020624.1 hypothetical protein [Streptococcus anginosus]MCW1032568.1 hypothetical protein [Streptococcus anginosus]MCW1068667.1 hypothetical protein [Streptococcus anginosus]